MLEHDPIDEELMLCTNYSWENFKDLKNNDNSKDSTRRIAVFEHKNLQYVRVYESTSKKYYFRCIECHSKDQEVKAKLSADGLMFKVFEPFSHICSPNRYLDVLKVKNAPVASKEQPHNKEPVPSTSNSEEEEEIDINIDKKKNQMAMKKASKKQTTEKLCKWIELDSSKFEYGGSARKGKTRLMVFESDKCDKVQVYGIDAKKSHYKCLKCNVAEAHISKDTVRIFQDHACSLLSYAKAKKEQEKISKLRIVQSDEFEYGMNQKHVAKKRLIIFEPNSDRKFCREYSYNIRNSAFLCMKCHPKFVSAKIFKDKNGNEFAEVSNAHRCKPRLYKGIKAEQDSFKNISGQLQIFKSPNFKFLLNAKGVANGRLIIFSTKTEVYEYYRQTNSTYLCLGCDRDPHNIRRKAYVIKDENGNECIKADMSHACEMISYKEVLKSQERIKERHGLL